MQNRLPGVMQQRYVRTIEMNYFQMFSRMRVLHSVTLFGLNWHVGPRGVEFTQADSTKVKKT